MNAEITFEVEKETKNTVRYKEVPEKGQPPIVGIIYIQKWFLGSPVPEKVRVTIETE